jgi:hypothetical protein
MSAAFLRAREGSLQGCRGVDLIPRGVSLLMEPNSQLAIAGHAGDIGFSYSGNRLDAQELHLHFAGRFRDHKEFASSSV